LALAAFFSLLVLFGAEAAVADACRGGVTEDTLRPIPQSLVPAAERLFGLSRMPDE
jgi:hypothetical protein